MARPRKEVNWTEFEKLCYLQCTQAEIMAWFEIDSKHTLDARIKEHYGENESFCTIYEQKRSGGRIAVRRKQFQVAESGNVSMLIWLGKQWLGQKDKQETTQTSEININIDKEDMSL